MCRVYAALSSDIGAGETVFSKISSKDLLFSECIYKISILQKWFCAVGSVVEHRLHTAGVTGSNPVPRTRIQKKGPLRCPFFLPFVGPTVGMLSYNPASTFLHFPFSLSMSSSSVRILGIDPGLNHTGYGVIDAVGDRLTPVIYGCIHVPTGTLSERLGTIYRELAKVIDATHPNTAAAEVIFLNINPRSTLLLGQARGAALTCAAMHGLQVHEYSASEIKNSVVGTGRAAKTQVQDMMRRLLGIEGELQADAADALACAVTCAHALKISALTSRLLPDAQTGKKILTSRKSRRNAWAQVVAQRSK